jgi:hypothetical protein
LSVSLDAEFDPDLEKWQEAKETQMNCVSVQEQLKLTALC